jgi:Tfp pilus assembly protein PilZ
MSEKRKSRRFARRLKVRFGEKDRPFHHSGLTGDISATGMFISTTASIKPGIRVHVEISDHDNKLLFFEGVVVRQVIVPAELRGVVKAGFGVRYLSGTELMGELVPSLNRDQTHLQVVFPSAAALRDAWDRELNRGGAFLWADKHYPVNSIVTVEFDLPFVGRRLAFESRVVHIVPEQQGKHGMAFMFLDVPNATAALSSVLHDGWPQ